MGEVEISDAALVPADTRGDAGGASRDCHDVATTRSLAAEAMAFYGESPSYKSMIEREGVAGPADLAIMGDETPVVAEVLRLRDCGTSEITT